MDGTDRNGKLRSRKPMSTPRLLLAGMNFREVDLPKLCKHVVSSLQHVQDIAASITDHSSRTDADAVDHLARYAFMSASVRASAFAPSRSERYQSVVLFIVLVKSHRVDQERAS